MAETKSAGLRSRIAKAEQNVRKLSIAFDKFAEDTTPDHMVGVLLCDLIKHKNGAESLAARAQQMLDCPERDAVLYELWMAAVFGLQFGEQLSKLRNDITQLRREAN